MQLATCSQYMPNRISNNETLKCMFRSIEAFVFILGKIKQSFGHINQRVITLWNTFLPLKWDFQQIFNKQTETKIKILKQVYIIPVVHTKKANVQLFIKKIMYKEILYNINGSFLTFAVFCIQCCHISKFSIVTLTYSQENCILLYRKVTL